jgi:hypothetical protein
MMRATGLGPSEPRLSWTRPTQAHVGTDDGLSAEREYTREILPRGIARGLSDLLRGDPTGLGRAGAILTGLAATTAG